MISDIVKPAVTRIITPMAKALLRVGLTPNSVTVVGAIGLIASAFVFYPAGDFIWGTVAVSFFALSDLFDGTMARISQKGSSRWGGFLDSTIDRITDSAVLMGLIFALDNENDNLLPVALIALLTGILVPYIRAKAESLDVECHGGLAERTERLIIVLLAILLHGFGVPFALATGIWLVAALGAVTSIQRILIVRRALRI
ncbi:MAG: CDP-alcohol phosphatidyltransferase family protein [Actinobacteria bacterium]|nr:CDP-alcohol phosphatidyltransferase family protein [Actinomycetota bacterium]